MPVDNVVDLAVGVTAGPSATQKSHQGRGRGVIGGEEPEESQSPKWTKEKSHPGRGLVCGEGGLERMP